MTENAALRTAKKVGRLPWVIVTSAAQADDEMIERITWCLETYGKVQIVKAPRGEQE